VSLSRSSLQPARRPRLAGNPRYKSRPPAIDALSTFLPLLSTAGCAWVSLQKGDPARQISALPDGVSVLDASSHDRDLAETAALIASLDLVITTDTCIAHLAGAMAGQRGSSCPTWPTGAGWSRLRPPPGTRPPPLPAVQAGRLEQPHRARSR